MLLALGYYDEHIVVLEHGLEQGWANYGPQDHSMRFAGTYRNTYKLLP